MSNKESHDFRRGSVKQSYFICLTLFSLSMLLGCTQEPDVDPISISAADVPADNGKLWGAGTFINRQNSRGVRKHTWGSDAYDINTSPVINADVLMLNVSYGGGCETHDFTLVTSGVFLGADPVELQAVIAHNANRDTCEAYLTETYYFDVSPLKAHYQKIYQTQEGTFVLRIQGIPEPVVYTF